MPEERAKRPKALPEIIGPLPDTDGPPAAWYMTLDEECLTGYDNWQVDYKDWSDRVAELIQMSGLKMTTCIRYGGIGRRTVEGFEALNPLDKPPRWWRTTKQGFWVPRKRTKAEREGEILARFDAIQGIPHPIDYIKGMPTALYIRGPLPGGRQVILPEVRKPGDAVLVLLAADPRNAVEPFEPDNRWTRLKLSTWHLIKEQQEAERALRERL